MRTEVTMTASPMDVYEITIDGKTYVVKVGDVSTSPVQVIVNGVPRMVSFVRGQPAAAAEAPTAKPAEDPPQEKQPTAEATPVTLNGHVVSAPMPGKVLSVRVVVGDVVKAGDTVCTLEAMKMEMPISAPTAGMVKVIHVNVGDSVAYNAPLVSIG
jgi:biotin carboxyl carrier protein